MDLMSLENECLRHSNMPIMQAIVKTESAFNPFAIGVVNGRLERQPINKEEAIATALSLNEKGFNYSMGLAQVNQSNLAKYGLNHATVFDPCTNIKTGSLIFNECNARAVKRFGDNQSAINAALSCYYSGNFTRGQQKEGMQPSYVEKVTGNMRKQNVIPVALARTPTQSTKQHGSKVDIKNRSAPIASHNASLNLGASKAEPIVAASWDVFNDF